MGISTFPAINNVQIIEIFVGMYCEKDHYTIQNTFQIIVKEKKILWIPTKQKFECNSVNEYVK